MGRKRDTAVQSVPETGVPASTPCDDLMSLYGNSFLTEMMCGAESAAPQEAGPEAAGPGLGTYTTVAAAADALSTTPNRNLTNPLRGMVLDAVSPGGTQGLPDASVFKKNPLTMGNPLRPPMPGLPDPRTIKMSQHVDNLAAGRQALDAGITPPPAVTAPMGPRQMFSQGLGVVDTVLSAQGFYDDVQTLSDDNASFDRKTRSAGSVTGNGAGAVGGLMSLGGSTTVGPALGMYAGGNALGGVGDQRMEKSVADGGFGKSASTWASEVGHDVQESLGSGGGAKVAGALATGGAALLSYPVVFGQGLMGMGEGLADLACYITDCDSLFESDEDRSPRGPSRDPEAVARRAAAVGECGDESTYDVDHWVSHGERRAPGPERTALPETVLLDDESPLFADPSEEYAAPAVEPLDADQQALLADWLKDTP